MNNGPKQKILIVDDERELSSMYQTALESEGFEVLRCDNGETALQQARAFKPDLILLDLMMPRLSGFEALELFRSTLETKAAKIVIFSALNRPEDIKRTKELGADDYIVKSSITFMNVVARIKELLGPSAGNDDSLVSAGGDLQG